MQILMINDCHSPSLKDRLKSSISCFAAHSDSYTLASGDGRRSQTHTPRSPYAWFKSTAQDLEIRDKCWGLFGRRGKNRRRYCSSDFKYDPTSYSLNFQDDINQEDDLPLNNFMARLPATPISCQR